MEENPILKASLSMASDIPLYAQLTGIIKNTITSGTLRVGDLLPSEAELCDKFEISPEFHPVRRQPRHRLAGGGRLRRAQARQGHLRRRSEHAAQGRAVFVHDGDLVDGQAPLVHAGEL